MKVVLTVEQYAKKSLGNNIDYRFNGQAAKSEFVNTFDTEADNTEIYCAFHKHANSKDQKRPIALFTDVNNNYDHKQRTLKHKTDRNRPITNHRPWPIERVDVTFCKRSVKMIDGSEKHNRQLAFELQNSHVCEKRSKNDFVRLPVWS